MALRVDSQGIAEGGTARGLAGHGRASLCVRIRGAWQGPAPHADLRDVALRTLLSRALTLWDNGRGRAAGLRKAANFDGSFGRAVRSIWRGV